MFEKFGYDKCKLAKIARSVVINKLISDNAFLDGSI